MRRYSVRPSITDCPLTRLQPAKRPTLPETRTGSSSTGIGLLTAAERRVQTKKDEKKDAEQPYSFLQDIQDVSLPLTAQLICLLFYRKIKFDLVQKGTIHVLYIFPWTLGKLSRPSRSRSVPLLAFLPSVLTSAQFWEIKQNHYDTVRSPTPIFRSLLTDPGCI